MATKKKIRKNKLKKNIDARKKRIRKSVSSLLIFVACVLGLSMLSVILVFGYDLFTQTSYFKATQITVSGNQRLGKKQIMDQAEIRNGVNILSLNLELTRRKLVSHPWISDAVVQREIPDAVRIRIREHTPLATVDLGEKYLMNRKGILFKKAEKRDAGGLPVISGLGIGDFRTPGEVKSRSIQAVMNVLTHSKTAGFVTGDRPLSRIHADRDLGLTLYAGDSTKIFKIGFSNYKTKFNQLSRLLNFLDRKTYLADFQSIDITDANRIVVNPVKENGNQS